MVEIILFENNLIQIQRKVSIWSGVLYIESYGFSVLNYTKKQ